jgi:hypothetical protein
MKKIRNAFALCIFAVTISAASQSMAFNPSAMNWDDAGNQFKIDNNELSGSFKDSETWEGTFCNGRSSYDNELTATINRIDFKLEDDNTLNATLVLTDAKINLSGSYKSELTFCRTIHGGFPINIDSVSILSKVVFNDGTDGKPAKMDVHVQSTTFGIIRFGEPMPVELEQFFTSMVNKGLKQVWSSSLGGWLDAKISDYLTKNFPQTPTN